MALTRVAMRMTILEGDGEAGKTGDFLRNGSPLTAATA